VRRQQVPQARPSGRGDFGGQETPHLRVIVHAAVERGAERARGERVDRDPGSGELDGEAAGELDDGALARGVAGPGRSADQAERTGKSKDAAISGCAHGLGGGAAGQPGSDDVDLQAGAQGHDVELIKGAASLHAGAGHEHVEPAMIDQDPIDQRRDDALVGDITGATRSPSRHDRRIGLARPDH
jgi:hypothetical protein